MATSTWRGPARAGLVLTAVCALPVALMGDTNTVPARAATGIYVLGPTELVMGTRASYRISVHWASAPGKTGALPGAEVTLSLHTADGKRPLRTLARLRTDRGGHARHTFRVPRLEPGSYQVRIRASSRLGVATEEQAVELVPGGRLLLTLDKPLYQPGQTIHVRALALRSIDRQPLARRRVSFSVTDPRGNVVFSAEERTSRFGVASADFELAQEVNLGAYRVRASVVGEDARAGRTVKVRRYRLPKFAIDIQPDGQSYRSGETVRGTVTARYFHGKPVKWAQGALVVQPMLGRGLPGVSGRKHYLNLRTDDSGKATFSIKLPSCNLVGGCFKGEVRIKARLVDPAGNRREALRVVPLSDQYMKLALVLPGGSVPRAGRTRLHVLAGTTDGKGVEGAKVTVKTPGGVLTATTDALGSASVSLPGSSPRACSGGGQGYPLQVTVRDRLGNSLIRNRCLSVSEHSLTVTPRRALVGTDEAFVVTVRDPRARRGSPAFLDVIRSGQTLVSMSRPFRSGRARFVVSTDRQVSGLLTLRGYRLVKRGERLWARRAVYVEPRGTLEVKGKLDRQTYRPGERARLDLQVTDSKSGDGVQAALGIHAVDQAVLSLAQFEPENATLYFALADHAAGVNKLRVLPGGRRLEDWLAGSAASRRRAVELLLSAMRTPTPESWETNPWQARRQAWQEQLPQMTDAAREGIWELSLGQRTPRGWRFHPALVSKLAAAGKLPRRYVRDPWQRTVRPRHLRAHDPSLRFAKLAGSVAKGKLEQLYQALYDNRTKLNLRREYVKGADRDRMPIILSRKLLDRLVELKAIKRHQLRDPWGNLYRVRKLRRKLTDAYWLGLRSRYEIYSLGPNERPYTKDDVVPDGPRVTLRLRRGKLTAEALTTAYGAIGGMGHGYGRGYGRLAGRRARAPRVVAGRAKAGGGPAGVRVRSSFPETLLWRPELITDRQGKASLSIPLADSITTWKVLVSASSARGALGRTSLDLRVFQPFFVDLDLPASLTQGDRLGLPVSIYNYLKTEQTVTLRLVPASWYRARATSTATVKLAPSAVSVVHFPIKVLRHGHHALRVHAEARDSSGAATRDAIKRSTLVEPDGTEHAVAFAGMLDRPASHTLVIPPAAIRGTPRLAMSIQPGPVSSTMEGLEGMLRMPGGCFEQTSSTVYPNVLVLDYLRRTGKSTPAIEARAKRYINAGYQRLLTFEVPGNGFSWFGKAPANKVLTAYGLMEFHDMARVHAVDRNVIRRTKAWLLRKQRKDGGWALDRQNIHDGVVNNVASSRLRVTAYIANALAHVGHKGEAMERALAYVRRGLKQVDDPYTLALVGNLMSRAGRKGERSAVLERLWAKRSETAKGVAFGGGGATLTHGRGRSGKLETTALSALALLQGRHRLPDLPKVMRTIVGSKDSFGSWYSTQATILSLRALLEQQRTSVPPTGTVSVRVDGKLAQTVKLDGEDRVHQIDLTRLAARGTNRRLRLSFSGKGIATYQVVGRYWLPRSATTAGVRRQGGLAIATRFDRTRVNRGDRVGLKVRVNNTSKRAVAMPLVSVALPPGFDVEQDALERIVDRTIVDKVQRRGNRALFYLSTLKAGQELRFRLKLRSRFPLFVRARPSTVYEYYRPEHRAQSRAHRLRVM